uniref:EamA domain-containing protein n=1 Tax=Macrostomum lignano TaxID=282301 RepID=A0A1I8JNI3_9PLAT
MLLLCAAVGLVWGVTNALMKASTAADTSDSKAWSLGALLRNWKYLTALAARTSRPLCWFLWSLAEASVILAAVWCSAKGRTPIPKGLFRTRLSSDVRKSRQSGSVTHPTHQICIFAGTTTTVSLETRKTSIVLPWWRRNRLHWVGPSQTAGSGPLACFESFETMQRPDLAKAGLQENFASSPSTIDETKTAWLLWSRHPYRLSEVQYLIRQFFYGVQCYSLDDTKISVIQYEVLQSKITTTASTRRQRR